MMNQLGDKHTVDVYQLTEDCKNVVKVDNAKEFGIFFAEEVYAIDVKGKDHRYVIMWQGPK